MKKVFILLVMFFIALGAYSTEQTKESLNDSTIIAQVNPTVVYFTEKLESLAKSLQVPAEHVYKVLVKKEVINAYSSLTLFILSFLISIVIFTVTLKSYNNANKLWRNSHLDSYDVKQNPNYMYFSLDEGWWIGGIIVSCVMFCLTLLGTIINGPEIITGIFNPEYGAIKEIMSLF